MGGYLSRPGPRYLPPWPRYLPPQPGQDRGGRKGVPQSTYPPGQGTYPPWPGEDERRGYPKVPTPQPRHLHPPLRTCYTADGMPLAFTQEDFLVHVKFHVRTLTEGVRLCATFNIRDFITKYNSNNNLLVNTSMGDHKHFCRVIISRQM